MKLTIISSHTSIRTVLFVILLIFSSWGIVASLQKIYTSLLNYRESENLSEWSHVTVQLLTAAQNLAYERGRAAVVLRGSEPITDKDRTFLDERRKAADSSLTAALGSLKEIPELRYSEVVKQWDKIRQLRQQVDRDALLSRNSRDQGLANRWFDTASDLIRSIQMTTEMLVGYFRPGEMSTRLTLLASSALELRITAGAEASAIAQALSAGETLTIERLFYIHSMRGREDRLWNEIDRLVAYTKIGALQDKFKEVKKHHLTVFRPLQDNVLSGLTAKRTASVPLEKLTAVSLPTLDGIAKLMTMVTEEALRVANEGIIQARNILIWHILLTSSLCILLLLSIRYVVRHVIQPLEQLDNELHRMGAFPASGDERGNEIDRLKISAETLEQSLAARAEAEEARGKVIKELQNAIEQIKTLRGIVPICSSCKKIRDDKGYWEQVDAYVTRHTEAQFSHGLCPECMKKLYPEFCKNDDKS